MMKRIGARAEGRVQGVGFRYFIRAKADRLGLSGWVRNLPGGAVEFEAQGTVELVDSFIREAQKGPPLSHVADLKIVEAPVEERETGFDIRY